MGNAMFGPQVKSVCQPKLSCLAGSIPKLGFAQAKANVRVTRDRGTVGAMQNREWAGGVMAWLVEVDMFGCGDDVWSYRGVFVSIVVYVCDSCDYPKGGLGRSVLPRAPT
jgi:hypothetical protein